MHIQDNLYTYEPKMLEGESLSSYSYNYFYHAGKIQDKIEAEIKSYFSIIYQEGYFLEAIKSLIKDQDDFCIEGCYCYYIDNNQVRLAIGLDEEEYWVNISQKDFLEYINNACLRFLEIHPEYQELIFEILKNNIDYAVQSDTLK